MHFISTSYSKPVPSKSCHVLFLTTAIVVQHYSTVVHPGTWMGPALTMLHAH